MTEVLFIVAAGTAPALRARSSPARAGEPDGLSSSRSRFRSSWRALRRRPWPLTVGGAQRCRSRAHQHRPRWRAAPAGRHARHHAARDGARHRRGACCSTRRSDSAEQAGAAAGHRCVRADAFLHTADDRTWRTLPGDVSIARVRLPPGVHEVSLLTHTGEQTARVEISGRYAVIDFRLLSGRLVCKRAQGRS